MRAYHVTEFNNLRLIKRKGLIVDANKRYSHAGKGVYIFFDKRMASDIIEFLGLGEEDEYNRALVVTVEVDPNELLMDEDALMIDDTYGTKNLQKILPPRAFQEYENYLRDNDGADELPINDESIATFKVDFINRYQIRPNKLFKVNWGHYSILTARCPFAPKIIDIEGYFDSDIYSLAELNEMVSEL